MKILFNLLLAGGKGKKLIQVLESRRKFLLGRGGREICLTVFLEMVMSNFCRNTEDKVS